MVKYKCDETRFEPQRNKFKLEVTLDRDGRQVCIVEFHSHAADLDERIIAWRYDTERVYNKRK